MAQITKSSGSAGSRALILLSSEDAPGLAKGLFEALAPFAITIEDVEQVVIHGRLILSVLIGLNPAHAKAIETDLQLQAARLGVDIAIAFTDISKEIVKNDKSILYIHILGDPLTPSMLLEISGVIGNMGANIESITRGYSPIPTLQVVISGSSLNDARSALSFLARARNYEIVVQTSEFLHARKMVVLDVDSTLIEQEVIELLARRAGVEEEVKRITESAMKGELDFTESLVARVALLKGLPASVIKDVRTEISLTPGAEILIKSLQNQGHVVGLVTGGFREILDPLITQLGIVHVKANSLQIENEVLTGLTQGPIVDRVGKALALVEFATQESIPMSQTIAIGDGANDIDMLKDANLGIAFCAKPALIEQADTIIIRKDLARVIDLLGIPRSQ